MDIAGRVQNGVVVLEGGVTLPEGTRVSISYDGKPVQTNPPIKKQRVEFPLVRSEHPGTLQLTAEQIAAYLEDEDVAPRH